MIDWDKHNYPKELEGVPFIYVGKNVKLYRNGRVFVASRNKIVNNRIIFTNFGYAKDITELVKNGEHPMFLPKFKFLVKEYEEIYRERRGLK